MKKFINRLKAEFNALIFPSKEMILSSTKFVIIASIILAVLITAISTGTSELCGLLLKLF